MTIQLNILEEHALDIIRGLEKLRAVEVVSNETMVSDLKPKKWGGAIKKPSKELLNYADEIRAEWEGRI